MTFVTRKNGDMRGRAVTARPRNDLTGWHLLAGGLALGLAGLGLNALAIPLGFSLHFLLGNIVIYIAIRFFGPGAGVLAGALAGASTLALWGHPWAWMIFAIEAVAVSLAGSRNVPFAIADGVFWVLGGIPLVWLTYGGIMGMDASSVWLVALKQACNGVLLASLGSLIGLISARTGGRPHSLRVVTVDLLLMFSLLPVIASMLWNITHFENEAIRDIKHQTRSEITHLTLALDTWVEGQSTLLSTLALPSLTSTRDIEITREGRISGLDKRHVDAVAVAVFDPSGQRRNQWPAASPVAPLALSSAQIDTIVRKDAESGGPVLRYLPNGGGIIELCLPLFRDGNLLGMVLAFYDRDRIGDQLALTDRKIRYTLLAPDGTPILWSEKRLSGPASFATREFVSWGGLSLSLPAAIPGQSTMQGWNNAFVIVEKDLDVPGSASRVRFYIPFSETVLRFRQSQRENLVIALLISVVAAGLAWFAGGRTTTTFNNLSRDIREISGRHQDVTMVRNHPITEVTLMTAAISDTHNKLVAHKDNVSRLQEQLRTLLRYAPMVVFTLSRTATGDWHILYRSPPNERLNWLDDSALDNRQEWLALIHPDDREAALKAFNQLSATGRKAVEYRIRTRSGDWRWVLDEAFPITESDDGTNFEAVGAIIDIQERRDNAERLSTSARLITLGEMATGLAHELNQPLNTIRIAAENAAIAIEDLSIDEESRAYLSKRLARICDQTDRASLIIDHMRIFGRRPEHLPEHFEISEAVEGAMTILRPELRVAGIDLLVGHQDSECPPLHGHRLLLEQVIVNLVLNARDAVSSEQQRRRADKGSFRGRISIDYDYHRLDGHVLLRVSDNGGGVPQEYEKRVFDPFFTTKPPGKGTGLGLALSFGIVNEMNGRIDFFNNGAGAVFTVQLPIGRLRRISEIPQDAGPDARDDRA